MPRLCDRAFRLLEAEIQRLCGSNPLEQVRRNIVLKRLETCRHQDGPPLTYAEIKDAVDDIFPEFDEAVLKKAAQANQPHPLGRSFRWVTGAALGTVALAGGLWFVNLPYPMIRWPVSRAAPMLLVPSFMSMDHSYRQAIIYTEQADQLINNATSAADFDLGAEKAAQAQKHLDRLPVWFLGYYPQRYCSWFSCGWRFTLDEFEDARALIGRMEAQIFQEQNALKSLDEGTLAVETAKRRYEAVQTSEEKVAILATWQDGMDKLAEIPPETLAGKTSQTRLQAFQRDYATLAGSSADVSQSNTFVQVAKRFASQAIQAAQNPPHSADTWGRIAGLWKEALGQLDQVPASSPGYQEAQALKADYLNNLGIIEERQTLEKEAVRSLYAIQDQVARLVQGSDSRPTANLLAELQIVIDQLAKVPPGTTVYGEAQGLRSQALKKQQELQAALSP
jgi:hypothetical protein